MKDAPLSRSIVQAISHLGASLGLAITAEGVETENQLVLLRGLGCGSIQGYFFSKPLPAAEIPGFIARHNASSRVPSRTRALRPRSKTSAAAG